ncbi:hypothetical protein V8C26DRAFT_404262 [Trichoderma gracile]
MLCVLLPLLWGLFLIVILLRLRGSSCASKIKIDFPAGLHIRYLHLLQDTNLVISQFHRAVHANRSETPSAKQASLSLPRYDQTLLRTKAADSSGALVIFYIGRLAGPSILVL